VYIGGNQAANRSYDEAHQKVILDKRGNGRKKNQEVSPIQKTPSAGTMSYLYKHGEKGERKKTSGWPQKGRHMTENPVI